MITKVDILKEVIAKKSKGQTLMVLESIESNIDDEVAKDITDPKTITELHSMLIEHLNVNPRSMMLKNRVQSRKRRALLFVRAMKNGVNKTE